MSTKKSKLPFEEPLEKKGSDNTDEFLTATEVANDYFCGKVTYKSVLKLTAEGMLPGVKIGKVYLYQRSALDFWRDRNFYTPPSGKLHAVSGFIPSTKK